MIDRHHRAAVVFAVQSWLGESEDAKKTSSAPGVMSVLMSGTCAFMKHRPPSHHPHMAGTTYSYAHTYTRTHTLDAMRKVSQGRERKRKEAQRTRKRDKRLYANQTERRKRKHEKLTCFRACFIVMALGVTYMPLFFPPTRGGAAAGGSGTEPAAPVPSS